MFLSSTHPCPITELSNRQSEKSNGSEILALGTVVGSAEIGLVLECTWSVSEGVKDGLSTGIVLYYIDPVEIQDSTRSHEI